MANQETYGAETGNLKSFTGWKRIFFIMLGLGLFLVIYFMPPWSQVTDPAGHAFILTRGGKGAIALSLMAGIWWISEVVPAGVTGLAVGVMQTLFSIRAARDVCMDFINPSILFVFGSVAVGIGFARSGLAKRLAYKVLENVGEKTPMILLGCMAVTAGLSHFMSHAMVAAIIFPMLVSIHELYSTDDRPTRFGKSLFIGMTFAASAGSIITMMGAARAPIAAGVFQTVTGKHIGFWNIPLHLFLIGWIMVFLIWGYLAIMLKPEQNRVAGLKERLKSLSAQLGPMTRGEYSVIICLIMISAVTGLRSYIPALKYLDRTEIVLALALLFFLFRVLTARELEEVPWNMILLFGGAMSIGFCLWKTGAAQWIAAYGASLFVAHAPWIVFVLVAACLVLIVSNFIINVVIIAVSLPVSLATAPYLGVSPEVVLYVFLAAAGMPFALLSGTASNEVAYASGQFTSGELLRHGLIASVALMLLLAFAVLVIWPLSGVPVLMK